MSYLHGARKLEPPEHAYRRVIEVERKHIDMLGHVNNLAYVKWMQDAAVAHSAAQGWPTQRYLDIGAGWVVRSHAIDYLQPAFENEGVIVRTWVAGFKKIQSVRKYRILRQSDEALLASAQTNWAFIGFEHGVPRRIPQEIISDFIIVDESDEPS